MSVFLSPFTNNDGAEINNSIAPSVHIQLHEMFSLKKLKHRSHIRKNIPINNMLIL